MFLAGKAAWAGIVFILPPLVPLRSQLLDRVRLCLRSAKGTRAPPRPCGAGSSMCRIETTSCAVNAEGHLNARIVVEVVTTFSSFQVL